MRGLAIAVIAALIACASHTKTPVSGHVEVSGTCGMDSGGEADNSRDYGYSFDDGADRSSVTLTIESGKLSKVGLEVIDVLLTPQTSESAMVSRTWRGTASPGVQLVVGEWVTVPVALRRVEQADLFDVPLDGGTTLGEAGAVVVVRVRILGDSAEFAIGQAAPNKGPCAWGRAD